MQNENGKREPNSGPPFLMVSQGAVILPYFEMLRLLNENAANLVKTNLALSPLFQKIIESFVQFGKTAEPGMLFECPEANLIIVRLSMYTPIAQVLTDAAVKRQQEVEAPKILTP